MGEYCTMKAVTTALAMLKRDRVHTLKAMRRENVITAKETGTRAIRNQVKTLGAFAYT